MAITVEERFNKFHVDNPHVYLLYKRFAAEALKAGLKRISSKLIIERIRWETAIATSGAGWHIEKKRKFKIDNRFTAWYARLFIKEYPGLADRFELREIRKP